MIINRPDFGVKTNDRTDHMPPKYFFFHILFFEIILANVACVLNDVLKVLNLNNQFGSVNPNTHSSFLLDQEQVLVCDVISPKMAKHIRKYSALLE